ncbi:MAG: hypothetical protein RMK74_03555 [Myxococcales bacterium]|nr:hypothetical protein [Myxococcales bacterium]
MTRERRDEIGGSSRSLRGGPSAGVLLTWFAVVGIGAGVPVSAAPAQPPASGPPVGGYASPAPTVEPNEAPLVVSPHRHDASLDAIERMRRRAVVARVGPVSITLGELEDRIARSSLDDYRRLGFARLARQVLGELAREVALALRAESLGLSAHAEVRGAERDALVARLRAEHAAESSRDPEGPIRDLVARLRAEHLRELIPAPLYDAVLPLPWNERREVVGPRLRPDDSALAPEPMSGPVHVHAPRERSGPRPPPPREVPRDPPPGPPRPLPER